MRILITLALLSSATAFACPDLTGKFNCQDQQGNTSVVTISQDNKSGVTVYNYNGGNIPADKQVYNMQDSDNLKQGTLQAWCDDDVTLKAHILGKYYDQGNYFGDLDMTMNMSIVGGNFQNMTTGQVKAPSQTYPLNQTQTCTRTN